MGQAASCEDDLMAALDLTHREIYREIRKLLLESLPDAEPGQIVQDAQNEASLPYGAIVMAFLFDTDRDYGVVTYGDGKAAVQNSVEARLQLSFYGAAAEERSRIIDTLWRSPYAYDRMEKCKPLYVQSRERHPYINDSNKYEERYILDLAIQYNPQVIYEQDFTETAEVVINPI